MATHHGRRIAASSGALWQNNRFAIGAESKSHHLFFIHPFINRPKTLISFKGRTFFASSFQNRRDDPFEILGISKGESTYNDARQAFLKIALKYHPDTIVHRNNSNERKNSDEETNSNEEVAEEAKASLEEQKRIGAKRFTEARDALAQLTFEGDDLHGRAILSKEFPHASEIKNQEFEHWYQSAMAKAGWHNAPSSMDLSNYHLTQDSKTMKEIAKVAETMSPGGLDRGGMWQMAQAIKNKVDCDGIDDNDDLRLGSGLSGGRANGGSRRRRKKK